MIPRYRRDGHGRQYKIGGLITPLCPSILILSPSDSDPLAQRLRYADIWNVTGNFNTNTMTVATVP